MSSFLKNKRFTVLSLVSYTQVFCNRTSHEQLDTFVFVCSWYRETRYHHQTTAFVHYFMARVVHNLSSEVAICFLHTVPKDRFPGKNVRKNNRNTTIDFIWLNMWRQPIFELNEYGITTKISKNFGLSYSSGASRRIFATSAAVIAMETSWVIVEKNFTSFGAQTALPLELPKSGRNVFPRNIRCKERPAHSSSVLVCVSHHTSADARAASPFYTRARCRLPKAKGGALATRKAVTPPLRVPS